MDMHPSTDRLRALAKDLTRYMNRKYGGSGDDLLSRVVDNTETQREAPTWATQIVQDLRQRFQTAVLTAADKFDKAAVQFDNYRFPFLPNCSELSAEVRFASVSHSFTAKNWRGQKCRCCLYVTDHAPPEYYIEYRNERNECEGITKITNASYLSFAEGLPKRFTFQSTTSQTQPTDDDKLALTFSDVRDELNNSWQWYVTVKHVIHGKPDSKWWITKNAEVIGIWQNHVEKFKLDKAGNVSKEKIIQSIYTLPGPEMSKHIILLDETNGIQLTIPPTEDYSLIADWRTARNFSQPQ